MPVIDTCGSRPSRSLLEFGGHGAHVSASYSAHSGQRIAHVRVRVRTCISQHVTHYADRQMTNPAVRGLRAVCFPLSEDLPLMSALKR